MIEFHCTGCDRLLRVGEEHAGGRARCPQCGNVVAVPHPPLPAALVNPNEPSADEFHALLSSRTAGTDGAAPADRPQAAAVDRQHSAAGDGPRPSGLGTSGAAPSGLGTSGAAPSGLGTSGAAPSGLGPALARERPSPPAAPPRLQPPERARIGAESLRLGGSLPPAPRPAPPPALTAGSLLADGSSPSRPPAALVAPVKRLFDRIRQEVAKIYVGQDELLLGALVALFSGGHVLIESVPGLGKTLLVRTLGRVLGCKFGRIQFTADLMPSDITGAPIFDMKQQEFRFRPGPVFTQLLLADEINRAPAKTHAALLEIMQEYRVTVDGVSHAIERPFLVLATQNPIESEGTYNLPEAQLDRFMFKLIADYPAASEETAILKLHSQQADLDQRLIEQLAQVASPEQILEIGALAGQIHVDDRLFDYINQIVRLTRQWPQFHMGASPRAGLALVQGARTLAAFCGRDYAVPDDVVQILLPALRHRVMLTAEAEVEGHKVDELLAELVRAVEVPRL